MDRISTQGTGARTGKLVAVTWRTLDVDRRARKCLTLVQRWPDAEALPIFFSKSSTSFRISPRRGSVSDHDDAGDL